MRIAGTVSTHERLEVDFIKSVHLVSRWVHEMFEEPSGSAWAAGAAADADAAAEQA